MTATLPPFPTDDQALDVLEDALRGSLVDGPDGDPVLKGAGFSLQNVFDLFSGYDPALSLREGTTYTYQREMHDLPTATLALIAEIRRLRRLMREGRT